MESLTRFIPSDCSGSMTALLLRYSAVLLSAAIFLCTGTFLNADETDEAKARSTTERFLKVLLANPRYGTAFDRVYSYHMDRGSIRTLQTSLQSAARLSLDPDAVAVAAEAEAIAEAKVAIALPDDADPANASLLLGLIELKHSESAAAISALQNAAALSPQNAMAHWSLARAYSMAHKTDDAVASLEQALKCEPARQDLLEIYKELARNLQRAQKPAEALTVWQRLESEFPGDLRVREQIAATLAEDGRWDESLTRYLALAQDSKVPDQRIQANLAASDVMLQLGRSQDAIKLLEKQLTNLDSDSWLFKDLRRRIESVFRNENDLRGLASYYEVWISTHPEDVDAMSRLARSLTLQDRAAEGLDWYRKAIELAPSSISLREALISQLVRDGQIAAAIGQYELMSKFDAGNRDHLEAWGLLYLSHKDLPADERQKQAANVWERLLTGREADPVTLARLAGLLRRADLSDRAIELYRTAIEKAPNEPQYREYLGEYLQRLQRTDEAVVTWKEMATGNRRTKENLIRLAEVLSQFDQLEPALESMRDACSLNPDPLERVQFAEMLRSRRAAGREPSVSARTTDAESTDTNAESHTEGSRPPLAGDLAEDVVFTEALEQLDLAEQSAETPDERQQILKERIQCLVAAGKLEQQIERLAAELTAGTGITAERWRTLALYQDAVQKTNEATASARKVVELQPDSIPGWTLLADLYERTGRLGDSADAMKKLASLDRRGISEYLRKTARLHVRLGQFDAALATGRDVIKATPGNPEAYQFFADLAFEVGQPKIAVDSLRQAVRVNPGDEASLKALAKTLADEFQTPEAIELYWRAFEKAPDLESQTQIVVALSNLYLRSSQFPKLIERLELRSRELNLPTEMTRCIATAYREAGDFRKASETLERLLIGTPNDVGLMREILVLAQSEGRVGTPNDVQRQLANLMNPDGDSKNLLDRRFDADEGETNQSLIQKEIGTGGDRSTLLAVAVREFQNNHSDTTRDICERLLQGDPNDWEALHWLRHATALDDEKRSREASDRILSLNVPFTEPGISDGSGNTAFFQQTVLTPQSLVAWSESATNEACGNFGAAYCDSATDFLLSGDQTPTAADFGRVFREELRREDKIRLSGCMMMQCVAQDKEPRLIVDHILNLLDNDTSSGATAIKLWAFSERLALGSKEADEDRGSAAALDRQVEKAEIRRLLQRLIKTEPEWLDLPFFYFSRPVQQLLKEDEFHEPLHGPLIEEISTSSDALRLKHLIGFACRIQSTELRKATMSVLIDRLIDESDFRAMFDEAVFRRPIATVLALFTIQPDEETNRLSLRLLMQGIRRSENFAVDPEPDLTAVLHEPLLSRFSAEEKIAIQNMLEPRWRTVWEISPRWIRDELMAPALSNQPEAHLLLAESSRLSGSPETELYYLIRAAELMPVTTTLRVAIVDRAAKLGLNAAALEFLDSLNVNTAKLQIWRELFVLQKLADSSEERRRLAAQRLFALPVSAEEQQFLIPILERLQMTSELNAVQARLGRGTETRQSVLAKKLQSYLAQGNEQLAGEVAWELLKLASGGTLFSGQRPNDDRDDGGERLQAIKALGKLKRLQPLIDRYEAMLQASPESLDLLEILCEFHEAAEQFPQLAEKRDRIALLSSKAPPSLKAKAVALENSGDVSGACDIYLQILKDDPEAFAEEMETYVQAFERAKRHADFLTAVLNLDEDLWSGNAGLLVNIIAELARAKTDDAVVQKSIESMLANEETRRLAIGGFLARPDVIAEEKLLPSIQEELFSEDAFADFSRCNETFLILQAVKRDASLKLLRDFITTRRAAGREPSVSGRDSHAATVDLSEESLAEGRWELVLIYLDARLGDRATVEKRLAAMFGDAANKAPSSGLAASVGDSTRQRREDSSPGGEKGQKDRGATARNSGDARGDEDASGGDPDGFAILVLNIRLKDLGKEWDSVRLTLLESLASEKNDDGAVEDNVLQELGSVYESLGQTQKARGILNQRVRQILASTGAAEGDASESIRQLLQAAEQIQHSGFPIEGARLLLNVTSHDIDEFTSDLDQDKAIAFKSRFNASQRWARQQFTAEKLVTWFEMSVSEQTSQTIATKQDSTDILLELSGVSDPRTRDKEQLQRLTMESVLLDSIKKTDFTDPDLIARTDMAASQLTLLENSDLRLLTVALAFSERLPLRQREAMLTRLAATVGLPNTNQNSPATERKSIRPAEALRSDADLSGVLAAGLLTSQSGNEPVITELLNRSAAAAERCKSRLVKIAVLNQCRNVAKRAGLKERTDQLESSVTAAVEEQISSTSVGGIDGELDLAREIRTRLLGQP